MASINDVYAAIKGMENAIIMKGGEVIKANSNPSLSEITKGIQSINTSVKTQIFTSSSPKHIITAELPGLTLNLKDPNGNIIDSKESGSMVELNTTLLGTHTVEAVNGSGEKIWNNEVEVTGDGTFYCKSGKKLNDYTWAEIKQAADGKYAKYMWSIGDTKIIHKWLGCNLEAVKDYYPETYNDQSTGSSLHQIYIMAWGGDQKSDGSGTTGITFGVCAQRVNTDTEWKNYYNDLKNNTIETTYALTNSNNRASRINKKLFTIPLTPTDYPHLDLTNTWPTTNAVGSTTKRQSDVDFVQWPCSIYRYLVMPKNGYYYNYKNVTSSTSGTYYIFDAIEGDFVPKNLPSEYSASDYPYYERIQVTEDGPIYSGLEDELKAVIAKVKKYSYIGYRPNGYTGYEPAMYLTDEYLWFPSFYEYYGDKYEINTEKYNYPNKPAENSTQVRYDHLRTGDYMIPLDLNSSDYDIKKPMDFVVDYYCNDFYEHHASYGKDSNYDQKETNSNYGYLYKRQARLNNYGVLSPAYTYYSYTQDYGLYKPYFMNNSSHIFTRDAYRQCSNGGVWTDRVTIDSGMNITNVAYCSNPTSVGVNTMIVMNPFKPNAVPSRSRYTSAIGGNNGKPSSSNTSNITYYCALVDDSITCNTTTYNYYINGAYSFAYVPSYSSNSYTSTNGCPCYFFSI